MTEAEIDELRVKGAYVGGRAEIRQVRAHKLSANLEESADNDHFGLSYKLQPAVAAAYDEGDSSFVIEADYSLQIRQVIRELADGAEPEDDDFADLAQIEVTVAGLFSLDLDEGDRAPTTEEVEAYSRSTGLFALHPYAREHIASLTVRLGLPALTIGVLRMSTGQVSDD